MSQHANSRRSSRQPAQARRATSWVLRGLGWLVGGVLALALGAVLAVLLGLAVIYPSLPDVSGLADYQPKLPLRIYSAEGDQIGEFGQERRHLTPIEEVPQIMKDAVLAVEDTRFYEHRGVDYIGVVRAAWANLRQFKSQGASTITMQVARNVYLSSEKTYTRKIYELLLTFKLEQLLSKDQILEIYMNQIFLGHRAYGFEAAAETYFGKSLKELNIAEAAMLAGVPKSPSNGNPITNFPRARERQLHIIDRMLTAGFISADEAQQAREQELHVRPRRKSMGGSAQYVAEMVRQMMLAQYGEDTYNRGLQVYTSIRSAEQEAAHAALRRGILNYERRQFFRGPEKVVPLPKDPAERKDLIQEVLDEHPVIADMNAALVLEANPKKIVAVHQNGQQIEITGNGLQPVQSGLAARASEQIRIQPGAIIRVMPRGQDKEGATLWEATQVPEVEGALVALDPRNGAIRALVGGFDFEKNKFNHVTQAWRQPGSSFKPFVYSAALEKGFSPATMVDDAPLYFDSSVTGGKPWEPKNYEGGFEGPMTLKRALARSRNLISIRILQAIGPKYAQDWIVRFGFDAKRNPAYLTMALGAGAVTPLQLTSGFGVFANGGYRVEPFLITRITDHTGRILVETEPAPPSESRRAIDARNAFIMNTMLQEVARSGTAGRAQATLKRPDLYGKTGTTNDALDAWFTGFQSTLVTTVWIGYDTPRKLGARETGGGLSLPIWIDFMQTALKGVPVSHLTPPAGVVQVGSDWYYREYAAGGGISNLDGAGLEPSWEDFEPAMPRTPAEERNRILDLFR